ncbi:protein FAM117A-like isoform X3 [Denticeps clupeoides]|uniref:protein FAM117A-like isoform X3 n=1 Tax=Denticeps clupeoides TaxID=299321 RepID=UPI0010A415BE|nr:protein FAM117A-like isoform X3 [Denticeps clupeoides]
MDIVLNTLSLKKCEILSCRLPAPGQRTAEGGEGRGVTSARHPGAAPITFERWPNFAILSRNGSEPPRPQGGAVAPTTLHPLAPPRNLHRYWTYRTATGLLFRSRGAAVAPRVTPPPRTLHVQWGRPPACSPRPNKTCAFPREPAEGCEGVGAWQDAASLDPAEPLLLPSSPDPNKVNFTPHGGSAFCPVSLLKPLLPSMDLLFRGLSVSQSAGTGPAVGGFLPGPLSDPATSTT